MYQHNNFFATFYLATKEKCHEPWQQYFSTKRNHFELVQDVIRIILLTKFYEEQTLNLASRVLKRQIFDEARQRQTKGGAQKLTMSTLCSGELKKKVKKFLTTK